MVNIMFRLLRSGAIKELESGKKKAEVRLNSPSNAHLDVGMLVTFKHGMDELKMIVTRLVTYSSFAAMLDENYFQRP